MVFRLSIFFRNDYRLDRFLFSRSISIKIDRRILKNRHHYFHENFRNIEISQNAFTIAMLFLCHFIEYWLIWLKCWLWEFSRSLNSNLSSKFRWHHFWWLWAPSLQKIWHRDIPYIVSGRTPFRALLLVHFSQCLFERIFFHFGESRAMKGVISFSFSKCWKGKTRFLIPFPSVQL